MSIADDIFSDGIKAYIAHDYNGAERSFRKVLEYEPYSSEAMLNLGNAYYKLDKLKEAEEIWMRTINTNPMEEKGYLNLGNLYFYWKNYAKAVYYWEIFKKVNPIHDSINLNLGMAYEALGQLVKAYKYYTLHLHSHAGPEGAVIKKRMDASKKVAEHNVQSAEQLMHAGKLEKAREAFEASVTLVPLHPKAYKYYATVLYQLNDLPEAIKWYELAYSEMEHDISILVNLGVAYEKLEDPLQALWAYITALRINAKKAPAGLNSRYKQIWETGGVEMLNAGLKRVKSLIESCKYEEAEFLAHRLWDVAFVFDKETLIETKQVVTFLTDRKNPRKQAANIAYALGEDLREKGQFERALPFYNRYLDLMPDGERAEEVRSRTEEMQKFISAVVGAMLTGEAPPTPSPALLANSVPEAEQPSEPAPESEPTPEAEQESEVTYNAVAEFEPEATLTEQSRLSSAAS